MNSLKSLSVKLKKLNGKGYKQQKRLTRYPHEGWQFPAKLTNEAIVLHSILPVYTIEFYSIIVNNVVKLIESLIRNHGFDDGAKRYKVLMNYTIALIEKRDPVNPEWLSTSRVHKIPSKLGKNFIKLIIDNIENEEQELVPKYYQCIITTLNIVRIVEGLVDPDFKSITAKAISIDNELLTKFDTYVSLKLVPFKYSKPEVNLSDFPQKFMKKGPNGLPKVESALYEAHKLLNSNLKQSFQNICNEMNCTYLFSYLTELVDQTPTAFDSTKYTIDDIILRKLVKVPDSGFKTRIVAIVDFWSQLILEPIRAHVQFVIGRLYSLTDFRLDQNKGVSSMVDFQNQCLLGKSYDNSTTLDVKHLKFYDITSWTDRFHRDLQKIVMKKFI